MKDGHTIWPMEVVRVNDWKFDILIGTDNMKEGHDYLVRVSNNRNLSPMGSTTFNVVKNTLVPLLLFPIPLPVRQPNDNFTRRQIEKLIFRTQMDHRVCKLCAPYANQEFSPNNEIPHIPRHFDCRCTFDVIFNDEFEKSFTAVQEVYQAAKAIRMLKIINVVEQLPA